MSWKVINELIGLASIDQDFCQELLTNPLDAVEAHGFPLTDEEKDVFGSIQVRNIHEFSQRVYAQLGSHPHEKD